MMLEDGGCPIGRHELLNHEWKALFYVRNERDKIIAERSKPGQGSASE